MGKEYCWPERVCLICGQTFVPCKRTSTTCSRQCANTLVAQRSGPQRAIKMREWGEGKAYPKIDGRHAHRVIAERVLGRALLPGEVVHHKNNNRLDYSEENLEVLPSQGEHCRLHFTKRKAG